MGKVRENKVLEYEGQHKFQPRSNGCSQTCKCNSSQLFTTHVTRSHEMDLSHTHMASPGTAHLEYLLWRSLCYLFNVHPSCRTAHHNGALSGSVHHNSKVGLPRNVQCFCDHHLVHQHPLPWGLLRLEFVANHLSSKWLNGVQAGVVGGGGEVRML